ncbi:hypothetical protein FACS1894147_02500 [Spirochaetia bacterium]|nr:hypothetical protein FACS1894147_02500 [Spirochaetia bacterium]
MKIEKAQLDDLKAKYGQIYEGGISFSDADGNPHEVEFVFREPKTSDVEAYSKNSQTVGVVTGNLNLVQSLIVYPEPAGIIDSIREYPNAYGRFIEGVIQPFFGANAAARKKKL